MPENDESPKLSITLCIMYHTFGRTKTAVTPVPKPVQYAHTFWHKFISEYAKMEKFQTSTGFSGHSSHHNFHILTYSISPTKWHEYFLEFSVLSAMPMEAKIKNATEPQFWEVQPSYIDCYLYSINISLFPFHHKNYPLLAKSS